MYPSTLIKESDERKIIAAIDVIPLHKFSFGFEAFARITSTSQPNFKFFVL